MEQLNLVTKGITIYSLIIMKTKSNYFTTLIVLALLTVSCNDKKEGEEKPPVVKVNVQEMVSDGHSWGF